MRMLPPAGDGRGAFTQKRTGAARVAQFASLAKRLASDARAKLAVAGAGHQAPGFAKAFIKAATALGVRVKTDGCSPGERANRDDIPSEVGRSMGNQKIDLIRGIGLL